MASPQSDLPPGFRFHPTDEELVLHYLRKKVASLPIPVSIIAEVDIYKFDPWQLPEKAAFGDKEWYFFSPRDRKYPNGARPNRAAASGYWKATGTDKTIVAALPGGGATESMGVKKALVFYTGKPPKGVKTNWIMHEYRLLESNRNRAPKFQDSSMRLDDWVLCRIYKKSKYAESPTAEAETLVSDQDPAEVQQISLPSSQSPSPQNILIPQKSLSFSNLLDATDFSMLSSFLSDNYSNPPGFESSPAPPADNSNSEVINLDHQPSQNIHTNSGYLFQRTPQLNPPSVQNMENNYMKKRQISGQEEDVASYPSKRYLTSCCSFPSNNNTNHHHLDGPQWNFLLKQSFLNQQLLPGPHLRFQG